MPAEVKLKDPKDWVYIGKHVPRIDSIATRPPARRSTPSTSGGPACSPPWWRAPPRFGGTVKSFDASAAKAITGVVDVVQIPQGVAVLARDTWSAMKGREALKVEWDDGKAETRSSDDDVRRLSQARGRPGRQACGHDAAMPRPRFRGAAKVIEAEFSFPYLAHAPMEPLNGVIEIKSDGSAEFWAGSQFQTVEQATVAAILGIKPEQVKINTVWAGGSFGRRATPNADYFAEMAAIAKASGGKAPVHLVWTREDDIKGGRYRPMVYHRIRAGLDAAGNIVGWDQKIVAQSFIIGTPFEAMIVKNGIDATVVEGAADLPYRDRQPGGRLASAPSRRSPRCGGARSATPTPRRRSR